MLAGWFECAKPSCAQEVNYGQHETAYRPVAL